MPWCAGVDGDRVLAIGSFLSGGRALNIPQLNGFISKASLINGRTDETHSWVQGGGSERREWLEYL